MKLHFLNSSRSTLFFKNSQLKPGIGLYCLLSFIIYSACFSQNLTLTRSSNNVVSSSSAPISRDQRQDSKTDSIGSVKSVLNTLENSTRNEIDDFFDFLKKVNGLPSTLIFPSDGDDDATFKTKSVALFKELDRLLDDPKNVGENWAKQIKKHLKVKSGFSQWMNSMSSRMDRLEAAVSKIEKSIGPETLEKVSSTNQPTRSLATTQVVQVQEAKKTVR